MKRTRDELIASFNNITGNANDDSALSFLEDLADSLNDDTSALETENAELKNTVSELEAKNVEIENVWREKYRARFSEPIKVDEVEDDSDAEDEKQPEEIEINDLFT